MLNILLDFQNIIFHITGFNPSRPDLGQREKINLKFLFSHFFVVPQKIFMKALKAFTKPFEAPQRSAKIKISVNFCFNINFLNAQDVKG